MAKKFDSKKLKTQSSVYFLEKHFELYYLGKYEYDSSESDPLISLKPYYVILSGMSEINAHVK